MTKRLTPLTVEVFQEVLMPQIKSLIDESHDDLEEKIKHLPTKEEYFAREDKTMGELKDILPYMKLCLP